MAELSFPFKFPVSDRGENVSRYAAKHALFGKKPESNLPVGELAMLAFCDRDQEEWRPAGDDPDNLSYYLELKDTPAQEHGHGYLLVSRQRLRSATLPEGSYQYSARLILDPRVAHLPIPARWAITNDEYSQGIFESLHLSESFFREALTRSRSTHPRVWTRLIVGDLSNPDGYGVRIPGVGEKFFEIVCAFRRVRKDEDVFEQVYSIQEFEGDRQIRELHSQKVESLYGVVQRELNIYNTFEQVLDERQFFLWTDTELTLNQQSYRAWRLRLEDGEFLYVPQNLDEVGIEPMPIMLELGNDSYFFTDQIHLMSMLRDLLPQIDSYRASPTGRVATAIHEALIGDSPEIYFVKAVTKEERLVTIYRVVSSGTVFLVGHIDHQGKSEDIFHIGIVKDESGRFLEQVGRVYVCEEAKLLHGIIEKMKEE